MASELEGLKEQLNIIIRKLNFFRGELAKASDAEKKFSLQEEINNLDKEKNEIRLKIREANEHGLFPPTTGLFNKRLPPLRFGEISCDRGREIEHLKEQFYRHQDQPFQHYFLSGQIEDKADSLVERFVKQELEPRFNVDCPTQADERILRVDSLPLSTDLERSQAELRRYFSRRFYPGPEYDPVVPETIDGLFQSNLPVLQKDYMVAVFRISKEHRKAFLPDFLQWIIKGFCQGRHPKLKLLFFYIFLSKKAKPAPFSGLFGWRTRERALKALLQTHPCCSHLPPLSWVSARDLLEWFDAYSTKILDADDYIEKAKEKHARHYHSQRDAFRMHVVEALLREIIEAETKPRQAI